MNKYNEIEIQTAKNLLEKGFKWITRGIYGAILAYKIKPDQEKYGYGNVICSDRVPIFESIRCGDEPVSLESIIHPQILDDDEKRYLKGVIRPFKDKVMYITKRSVISDSTIEYSRCRMGKQLDTSAEEDRLMKVNRMTEVETNRPEIGDRISVGHYTATCQEITPKGTLFLLDQYLDKPMAMNPENTNKGGYEKSDLRKALQSDEVLDIFADWRDKMVPFENGDLLRIPFAGELFDKPPSWCEPDGHEQWPLMRDRRNCIASRCGEYEWGWLQNKGITSSAYFCVVGNNGGATYWTAWDVIGVRPAFLIAEGEY